VQLEHSFSVPVGIAEAWPILIDIERIGPCLPGAAIDSVDGDDFTGTVKVKLGPINLTYKGRASFVEKDEAARRAVIDARGRDARGNGTAAAKITATLHEDGDSTLVRVLTDLDITGKPAQFGRGVMVDVGTKLLGQFADCLATTIKGGDQSAPATAAPAKATAAKAAPAKATPRKAAPTKAAPTKAAATKAAPAAPAKAAAPPEVEPPEVEPPTTEPPAEGAAQPARAPAPPPTDAAEPVQDEPDGAGSAEALHDVDRVPAYSVPAGVPAADPAEVAAVNGSSPAAERAGADRSGDDRSGDDRSGDDIAPIDLLQSAGPAVAKRVAPLAVALLFVLIAIRRYRRR
jgi:carbon monoxide dehydrogenase subunit G